MEKRFILAITLSMLVFLTLNSPKKSDKPVNLEPTPPAPIQVPTVQIEESANDILIPKAVAETFSTYEDHLYNITFSETKAYIKDLGIKLDQNGKITQFDIVKDLPAEKGLFSLHGKMGSQYVSDIVYGYVVEGNRLIFKGALANLHVTKTIIIDEIRKVVSLAIAFENKSDKIKSISYDLIGGVGIVEKEKIDERFIEVKTKVDGKVKKKNKIKKERIAYFGDVTWASISNKYFTIALEASQQVKHVFFDKYLKNKPLYGITEENLALSPGDVIQKNFEFYIGPNKPQDIKKSGLNIEEVLNFGMFGTISNFLLKMLTTYNGVVKNWGISIVLLTFTINIILLPLTIKSFDGMRRMQELQPKIEKLRKDHKSNPQRLNKEIGALYKEHRVNPLSSCLPMFLQFPILIALYNGLLRFIELKNASFLWISDLSRPDDVPLPFTLPLLGNTIHALPLIMTAIMFVQQKISMSSSKIQISPEQKQQQKIMLIMMPVIFGFMFYGFPSGLVLYWLTSTLLTTTEHAWLRRNS